MCERAVSEKGWKC